jgi:proteasome lid subunit RPN8/RPN11
MSIKVPHPHTVVVHPLVLLSTVDHYNRVAKDTRKRVIGVLLGESSKGRVDVTNSFAVPFEEDPKNTNVMYLDHDYLEVMANMFRRINAKERIVGFYSTGPQIRLADLKIDEIFRKYATFPVLVVIDVRPDVHDLPVKVRERLVYTSIYICTSAFLSLIGLLLIYPMMVCMCCLHRPPFFKCTFVRLITLKRSLKREEKLSLETSSTSLPRLARMKPRRLEWSICCVISMTLPYPLCQNK